MNSFFNAQSLKLAVPCIMMLTGCMVGPSYVRPRDSLPSTYIEEPLEIKTESEEYKPAQSFVSERELPTQWWRLFKYEPLNQLVEASLINSPTVKAAQAALDVAVETVYAQEGFLYPTINAEFIPTRNKTSRDLASNTSSNAYYYSLYTLQGTLTYTVDVFGGIRRQIESLKALSDSQCYTLENTYLILISNVVQAAVQEVGLRGLIASTKKIIEIQRKFFETFKQLFEFGHVSQADVITIEALLAVYEASLPPLEKQLAIERDLIKILAGRFPNDTETPEFPIGSLQLPAELPVALPSTLVEFRPDVRAAEEQLHSACADIGAARANRLPKFTLTPNIYGYASTSLGSLFDTGNVFWEIALDVLQTVYDGDTLKHKEDAAWAAYKQAVEQYRVTVLGAFQDVADALHSIQHDAKGYAAAKKAENAASKSLKIVQGQLEAGDVNLLIVLTAEQIYHQALLNLVQAETNRLSDSVALFRALGGGRWWESSEEDCELCKEIDDSH